MIPAPDCTVGLPAAAAAPVALEAVAVLGDGQVSSQTHGGAEELRRAFPLERRLAFQQDLKATRRNKPMTDRHSGGTWTTVGRKQRRPRGRRPEGRRRGTLEQPLQRTLPGMGGGGGRWGAEVSAVSGLWTGPGGRTGREAMAWSTAP